MRDFSQHSTYSAGKKFCMDRLAKLWVPGGICALVGCGEGLPRHVNEYRKHGIEKIFVYELVTNTYRSLVQAKIKYFPYDENIHIIHGNLLEHDFKQNPVENIDFDACNDWSSYFYWPTEDKELPKHTNLDALFYSGASTISCTFSQRNNVMAKINSYGKLLDVPKVKKLVTKYIGGQYVGYTYQQGYKQADVAKTLFASHFPEFNIDAFGYKGLNPMITINATKNNLTLL